MKIRWLIICWIVCGSVITILQYRSDDLTSHIIWFVAMGVIAIIFGTPIGRALRRRNRR